MHDGSKANSTFPLACSTVTLNFQLVGADLDDDEVMEFDPRVGFRLKTADYSAVYRCPSEGTNINVLVVPFNPGI